MKRAFSYANFQFSCHHTPLWLTRIRPPFLTNENGTKFAPGVIWVKPTKVSKKEKFSVSFRYRILEVSPKLLRWLWSAFGLDPSRGTLLIFRSYNLQKSSLRELDKEFNKYHLKYQGSKGLVSSSFFWAAEWRGQVTPSNYADEALGPKRLRQLQKVFSISLRKSVPNIIIIRDYLQRNVSLSISLELKNEKIFQ